MIDERRAGGGLHTHHDPVCGMAVDPATAKGEHSVYAGTSYWFCKPHCKDKFDADAPRYLTPARSTPSGAASEVGRLAVLRARRRLGARQAPQHVHADRDRHIGGVRLLGGSGAC